MASAKNSSAVYWTKNSSTAFLRCTGCGTIGGECNCSDQMSWPTEEGAFVVHSPSSDPEPLDGAAVSFQGDRVTIDYTVAGAAVSVEYVVADVSEDFR